MSSWTLEGELAELAGRDNLVDSLRTLGLIGPQVGTATVETVCDWYRSGAETYSLRFAVIPRPGRRREFFMKACVAYAGGRPLSEIFADWLSRRNLIQEIGISIPVLYATGAALVVEEYISYTIVEALAAAVDRIPLLQAIGSTAAHLVNAGFAPLSTHDWRSRGKDVVLVDFGQDLGPAGIACGTEAGLLSDVLDNLSHADLKLTRNDLRRIGTAYEDILHE